MNDPRYLVGKFQKLPSITDEQRKECIRHITEAPVKLRAAVAGLSEQQLDTPYREGGWTVRQTVHHLPDSHLNAYIRFKLAVTESEPTIKPYHQELWAELTDARTAPVETSLHLLEALHQRWVIFLNSLAPSDFAKIVHHPESGVQKLDDILQLYSWHGRHHTAQITSLRERMGW